MTDLIIVDAIPLRVHVGGHAYEQDIEQPLFIDLRISTDARRAGQTDELKHTVDYVGLVEVVRRIAALRHYTLLESLAEEIASALLEKYPKQVSQVQLRIHKPGVFLEGGKVSVEVIRPWRD